MVKLRNILADGREVEDLTGYVVPASCGVYEVLRRVVTNREDKLQGSRVSSDEAERAAHVGA